VALIKVKSRYQATLLRMCDLKRGVAIGEIWLRLRSKGEHHFNSKRLIDQELKSALNEVKRGRIKGPFLTRQATIRPRSAKPSSTSNWLPLSNLRHPSLRAKKYDERNDMAGARG